MKYSLLALLKSVLKTVTNPPPGGLNYPACGKGVKYYLLQWSINLRCCKGKTSVVARAQGFHQLDEMLHQPPIQHPNVYTIQHPKVYM